MDINVNLSHQTMRVATDLKKLVAGSQKFIRFVFKLPSEWDDFDVITVQFIQNGLAKYDQLDENHAVYLPSDLEPGDFLLLIYGSKNNGEIRGTVNALQLTLTPDQYIPSATEVSLTENMYDQLIKMVTTIGSEPVTSSDIRGWVYDDSVAILRQFLDNGDLTGLTIPDKTIEKHHLNDELQASIDRADSALQYIPDGSVTRSKVDSEIEGLFNTLENLEMTIPEGSIDKSKVNSDFAATLDRADSAMQPSVYDVNNRATDIFNYADSKVEPVQTLASSMRQEMSSAYTVDETSYDSLGAAINGALTQARTYAKSYTDVTLGNYVPYSVAITATLPPINLGQDRTFYLVPKASGNGYDKWWVVENLNHTKVWDNWGGSSTLIVTELPQEGDVDVDYILAQNGDYKYYKYIDNEWKMIAGTNNVFLGMEGQHFIIGIGEPDTDLITNDNYSATLGYIDISSENLNCYFANVVSYEPDFEYEWDEPTELVEFPSSDKDYYVLDNNMNYVHLKYNGSQFNIVGSCTFVVNKLPTVGITNVDYLLFKDGEYQYYKYIDGAWKMISGGSADVIVNEHSIDYYTLPPFTDQDLSKYINKYYLDVSNLKLYTVVQSNDEYQWQETVLVSNPSDTKDYYIRFGNNNLLHFRFVDNVFIPVGFTQTEIDSIINPLNTRINTLTNRIDGYDTQITQNQSNIASLNNTVSSLQQAVSEIDTEGYEYFADYGTYEVAGQETNNVYRLRKVKGSEEEVVSQFVIQGGGGGQQTSTNLVVERITQSPLIVTPNDNVVLEFRYSSVTNDDQKEEIDGNYTLKLGNTVIASGECIQGINSIDVTSYCTIGTQRFSLNVVDLGGSSAVRTFTVQKVDVRIESEYNDRYYNEIGKSAQFTYTPYGAINKTIHFSLNGEEETITTAASGILQSYAIPAQPHGSYLLDVWVTATVNGTDIETNHIYKDIMWYDPNMDGQGNYKSPVIGCNYRYDHRGAVSVRQYDTLPIVYNVYDPTTNYPIVRRYIDNVLVGTDTMETTQNTWNFKSDIVGEHNLRIECRDTVVTIVVNVTELGIDVSPITGGLELDFNPVGITNSSENRIWSNDNYHMTVSQNFDWANGGYKTDENGNSYFLIKAGTTASFDYTMFSGGVDNNPSRTGSEMKIIFMTENVQDADAVWFSNVETRSQTVDETTVTVNMGIQMSAHNGWLKTNKASDVDVSDGSSDTVAATNTYLYMPYSEEDIIEMDINIDTIDLENETSTAFVMSYEDGVPSKAYVYDRSDRFYQYDPQPITIGSTYCDVRIYRLKIYSTSLTSEGIMRNFIADSMDSTTMLARYDRNSIYYNQETGEYSPYNTNGILSPERLAPIVPNVKILMLETDHFTTSKKTFVKSNLRCIHAPGGDVYPGDEYYDNWYFENGWHSGQGTTSDNYGNSGRNVDFLFNCDGVHKPSDKIKDPEPDYISKVTLGYNTENAYTETVTDWKGDSGKISLTRTSIPNNFFNLKVNIASSENANNALMQKRYTDFLPYISPAKRRDPRIKNDMEFVPAILFIKETNPDLSTHNEFQDNEWHFYALGNLGDSKKTDYTRSYDPEDMNEFTIEISDNTKNNATFQTGVYQKQDGSYGYETFHLIKTLDKEGELVVTPVSEVSISEHISPVPYDQIDALLFQQGTIHVINETGLAEHDGDEYGYLNMRIWCLYNEGFDGDHSFEPRYACCGDYRDGKLVNDYSGYGKQQVKTNEKVWRAFYKWVITSTNEQFLQELDQWCVRSAVEFFYAFTLYYTMMDNRAKNTFWHFAKTGVYREVSRPVEELLHIYCELVDEEYVPTEDTSIDPEKTYYTQYAFDLWCYDTDTGLGINNNGELIFPYGKEDTDYNIDGDPSSGWVFNGATSVFWCRLRDLLSNEITETFNSVSAECFNATNLINQFDKFQGCYPEEIWRLDVERKYVRTYTGKSVDNSIPKHDTQYLRDMMQGRKKYQRRQWVRDQEMYFGTKYLMNTVVGDNNRITFRCYDPGNDVVVPKNYSLSITPFQDMYVSAMFGNGDQRQVRAKAGETVVLNFSVSTTTDTQVTIYGANRIAALNDLSACYIAANNFSMATKLRKLVLGNTTPGYSNSRLTSLTLGSNKLLEELDLRNCNNLTGTLNLADCSNLLKLYADGTRISSVTFATNGKVQIVHLPPTLNTLVMRNLNDLQDFQCSMDYLEQLTLQGGTLNSYEVISDVIDTLSVVYLYDLDWTVPNSDILNQLLNLEYSTLTGKVYINGATRLKELERYNAKWADLTVTYNPNYLVEQYAVTYVNDDGTTLGVYYVDRGAVPPNPVEDGTMETPTKASDAQYTYTFSGWDDIESVVLAPRTIKAQYSETIRTYTVTWYSRDGVPIRSTQAEYGSEVVYDGNIPTRTDEEAAYWYNIFTGWDKSTGYITGDTDVYAIWDRKVLPVTNNNTLLTKDLNDMSPAEIYALGNAQAIDLSNITNLEAKDYKDIVVGNDFNFNNVESEVLLENRWFDGKTHVDTNIKLFSEDSEDFTLAIDFEFYQPTSNATLVSCFEEDGSEGFRLRYNQGSSIQWGDKSVTAGPDRQRSICVIRHLKGSDKLYTYVYNTNSYQYDDAVIRTELTRTRSTTTDSVLSFGAIKFPDGGYDFYAKGWIHWCKIWYADLGNANALELAQWPHETWRVEYTGLQNYRLPGTSRYARLSFSLNNLLLNEMVMAYSSSNAGGWPASKMRVWENDRIYKALPVSYRAILKQVRVCSSAGSMSSEIVYSDDYIYAPSLIEVSGNSQIPYGDEIQSSGSNKMIPWYTSDISRIKFLGQFAPSNPNTFYSTEDPTINDSNNVTAGDIWYRNSYGTYYMFIPKSEYDRHEYKGDNIVASNGGLWYQSAYWFTRTPDVSYNEYFRGVGNSGNTYTMLWPNSAYGVNINFSV